MSTIQDYNGRWKGRGQRPVRIANCSGARMDPGYQMLRQATQGDVDFITGDYLAEMNLAENAEAFAKGTHPGYEATALEGLQQSLEVIAQNHIKVVINGGSINPSGLAQRTEQLAKEKGLLLKIAYVEGDNLLPQMREMLEKTGELPEHLDPEDAGIHLAKNARDYVDRERRPLVAANAYLGARAIVKGLELGADIIICGRVADASPVIGAAWYWHSWRATEYDRLAGALIAGHLIECSGYVTGSNFSGFTEYPLSHFVDIAFGIAEVAADGSCVITKHENTNGLINADTVINQFLYELQGDIYLNSDVKAYLSDVQVSQLAPNRVRVTGIKGAPPPPTTKLAIFYKGGFQSELLINATGYGTAQKYTLQEEQLRHRLEEIGIYDKFDVLDFQFIGCPERNPKTQLASTTYLRVFAQAAEATTLLGLLKSFADYSMQHFSGMHMTMNNALALPKPFLAFYPAIYPQDDLAEKLCLLSGFDAGPSGTSLPAGHPPTYSLLERRTSYDTYEPLDLNHVGPTREARLGDIFLARSGDKGANVNFGIFPRRTLPEATQQLAWDWLLSFLSMERMRALLGDDWKPEYALERVEFVGIKAVHFVVYGWLGRGVTSATTLDALGKAFADYIRDKVVEMPVAVLEGAGKATDGSKL